MARFQTFGIHMRKNKLWTKVAKLAKPQGLKWHFTLKNIITNKDVPEQKLFEAMT
ncbi:hypothetical protein Hanom_Chr01g00090881 [Helianthus anomalus]